MVTKAPPEILHGYLCTLSCQKVTHFKFSEIPKNASLLGTNFGRISRKRRHALTYNCLQIYFTNVSKNTIQNFKFFEVIHKIILELNQIMSLKMIYFIVIYQRQVIYFSKSVSHDSSGAQSSKIVKSKLMTFQREADGRMTEILGTT